MPLKITTQQICMLRCRTQNSWSRRDEVTLLNRCITHYNASKFFVAFGVVSSFRCFVVYLAMQKTYNRSFNSVIKYKLQVSFTTVRKFILE